MISLKKNKKRFWLITVLITTACLISYTFLRSNDSSSLKEFAYYEVKKRDLSISVTENGILKAVEEEVIKNLLDGKSLIVSIVEEGTKVKKGDLLVELNPADSKKQLQQSQLDVETSKASLITAQNDLLIDKSTLESELLEARQLIKFAKMDLKKFQQLEKQQKLRDAESKITTEEESLKLTEEKFQWSEKLAKKGFETKSQVERDKLELRSKKKALESAKSALLLLTKFDLPKLQAERNSKVEEANKKYERLLKQGESKMSRAEGKLVAAKRKLKVNEKRLADYQVQLRHSKIYAPKDGIILYEKSMRYGRNDQINQGAMVTKNRKLITIPNLKKMKTILKVPEFHISKVKLGQEAYVTIESVSDKQFKAIVTKVSPLPDRTNYWSGAKDKFYVVEATITDTLPDVKPSISAKTEIAITDLTNIYYLPLQAIRGEKNKYYCYLKKGDDHVKTAIELGQTNNNFAEIKSGISDRDQVLLNLPDETE